MVKSNKFNRGVDYMDMSIAALSVSMHQAETWQDLGIAVLKKAMEADTEMAEEVLEIGSLDPNVGQNIDISI